MQTQQMAEVLARVAVPVHPPFVSDVIVQLTFGLFRLVETDPLAATFAAPLQIFTHEFTALF